MGCARLGMEVFGEHWRSSPVKLFMRTSFTLTFGIALVAIPAFAGSVQVPAKANPWLAGMTNGATARRGDSAPEESPVLVDMAIAGGATYTFSASGSANHGSTLPFFPPDGEDLISHYLGAENGIADMTGPFVSLVGVFLGPNAPDADPAPRSLDFRNPADRDYLVLAPALKQPFFIGDGSTSSGSVQQVLAPAGATRLFLGTMDQYNWSDNEGSFTVEITRVSSAPAVQLPLHPSANPTLEDAAAAPAADLPAPAAVPGPELRAFTAIELVWPSEAKRVYQVQWTPSLDQPEWQNIGPSFIGWGGSMSFFDSTRTHPKGFYRVQVLSK
jgi:hypothetical protein